MRAPHAPLLRQGTHCLHPKWIHYGAFQNSPCRGYFLPPFAGAGTHDASNKGLHQRSPVAPRRNGRDRGAPHVHANAWNRERQFRNDHFGLLRGIHAGKNPCGVFAIDWKVKSVGAVLSFRKANGRFSCPPTNGKACANIMIGSKLR